MGANPSDFIKIGILIGIVVIAYILITSAFSNFIKQSYPKEKKYTPYISTYDYSWNNMTPLNKTRFMENIQQAKDLGFKGIKLCNIECYYAEGYLLEAVRNISKLGLKVIIPLKWFDATYSFPYPAVAYQNIEGFPDNQTQLETFLKYVYNVSYLLRDETNIVWFVIHFPFNWEYTRKAFWAKKIMTLEYKVALQQIINEVRRGAFATTKIFLTSELIEIYTNYTMPTDFDNIAGFGFQPYSLKRGNIDTDQLNTQYKYWRSVADKEGKRLGRTLEVYIDEWGFRTKGNGDHGYATDEANKVQLIREMVDYLYDWNIVWTYFGLLDFPPEAADWGIVYDDGILKPSGLVMRDLLRK
ncbi:MAG: hypothetical protein QW231_04290 [Candidatus Bathyarchaeia archaeon]